MNKAQSNMTIVNQILGIVLLFLSIACSKDNASRVGFSGPVEMLVSAELEGLSQGGNISMRANSDRPAALVDTSINLNENYFLQAELIPSSKSDIEHKIIKKNASNNADLGTSSLAANVWYRLLIFKKDGGNFVTERLYQKGKENDISITPKLFLDGGVAYTFIAYSVNSTTLADLPALGGPATEKNVSNCFVSVSESDVDLLFFKHDQTITGEATDILDIIFEHQFNQLTVIIDASLTGYNISNITANLVAKNPEVQLNFSDGQIARTTSNNQNQALTFTGYGTTEATSGPVAINTGNISDTDRLLTISKMVIGPLTFDKDDNGTGEVINNGGTAYGLFKNVSLMKGYKYTLILSIIPTDKYMDDYDGLGLDAVRINGQVWMRHNLRADGNYSSNPDEANSAIFGNYYQWGRKLSPLVPTTAYPDYNSSTYPDGPTGWTGVQYNVATAWNKPSEEEEDYLESKALIRDKNPVKNVSNDPCPTGYRVPSKWEFENLVLAVVASNIDGTVSGPGVYTAAHVLTSKRNASVKLTIPMQGYYPVTWVSGNPVYRWLGLRNRGVTAYLWSSFFSSASPGTSVRTVNYQGNLNNGMVVNYRGQNGANTTIAMPIRCIAEDSSKDN